MYYSPLEEVNRSLSAKRQDFLVRRQSGIAVPIFPLNQYYPVDSHSREDNFTFVCKDEVKKADIMRDRCYKMNLKCDDSFSSVQEHSYLNDSTLVNSTTGTISTLDLLPQIASPVPIKPNSIQYLSPLEQYSKKRQNEGIDAPNPKRQTANNHHSLSFISSDIISSDPFRPLTLSEADKEKRTNLQQFPYFTEKQISNLVQSSFDPIFSED